jgi:hypothetical protein
MPSFYAFKSHSPYRDQIIVRIYFSTYVLKYE